MWYIQHVEPTMELWWYINLHKLDLTISNYHIWYLTNSHKTVQYHQLWGRPSAPHPRLWQPPSLLDGRVQSYSPSVFIFFRVAGGPTEHFLDGLYHFIPIKMVFMMVLWWFYDGLYPSHWWFLLVIGWFLLLGLPQKNILKTSCPGTVPRCLWHG